MPCLFHVFTAEELEDLDQQQLLMLDEAIIREIQTNPDIVRILQTKLGPLHERLKARRRRRP